VNTKPSLKKALTTSVKAARAVGVLMRRNLRNSKTVNSQTQHDIKLELDVRSQKLIERTLHAAFPDIPLLGEEGSSGDTEAEYRWVVDPIDGTVNFSYGIPHACVSIAMQQRVSGVKGQVSGEEYQTVLGVVYDPFTDEMWTAVQGQPARLNGRLIQVSRRSELSESVVGTGFSKSKEDLEESLPYFNRMVGQVRKMRIMGAAALSAVYVATGRFDAYVERNLGLWDIAAGGFIVERAGGEFWRERVPGEYKYRVVFSNGLLRKKITKGWI
jgi:myo-inositol-1(or 4)-monophosphatase